MSDDFQHLIPVQNRQAENTEDNLTVILIPKFGDHIVGRWLIARMRRPFFKLKLDEVGSFVWAHCDGKTSVEEIGRKLEDKFGEKVKPVRERLNLFFKSLERSKSITWC